MTLDRTHNYSHFDFRQVCVSAMVILLSIAFSTCQANETQGGANEPLPQLHLLDGGFVSGTLLESPDSSRLRWQSPRFTVPFEFARDNVNFVSFPLRGIPPKPAGDFCFELAGMDTFFGKLLRVDVDGFEVESERLGRVKVRRDQVARIYRWSRGNELLYLGPDGLGGWAETNGTSNWREEGGQPFTSVPNTAIFRDFSLPSKVTIEVELSWTSTPDFVLAFGVNGDDAVIRQAFRLEVWGSELVIQREVERAADLASIQTIENGAGRIRLHVLLDQDAGRAIVYSPTGSPLANMLIPSQKQKAFPGLRLTNNRGNIRLERLRISQWSGSTVAANDGRRARVHMVDGTIHYGNLIKYEVDGSQCRIQDGNQEKDLPFDQIAEVVAAPAESPELRQLRATWLDGTRVSGLLSKIEADALTFECPGFAAPVRINSTGLRSLAVLSRQASPEPDRSSLVGSLELPAKNPDTQLKGFLIDGTEQSDSSCLVWQPLSSITASPLRRGVEGKIVYREPPPPLKRQPQNVMQARPRNPVVGFLDALVDASKSVSAPQGNKCLHLRCGDTIPCEIIAIDEQGVTIRTDVSDATFVSHEKIKAAEMITSSATPKLNKAKRERLLTLPRMQKASPPTHLICSKNGDFLRGRIMSMDKEKLVVEVRLEEKLLPTNVVTQIIWLHPDELGGSESDVNNETAGAATRVQVQRNDGIRFTFQAEQSRDSVISGSSDVLGACRAELANVDRLLIGSAIEQAAADLAFQRWKLQHAVEPRFTQDDPDDSERSPGMDSPLVGKPAPDFKLDTIGGKPFKLLDHRGQVIVLDFWATWCGPCLQAMPEVERVVEEFADKGVMLIAVNLEEMEGQIKSTMERHKLHATVALDRDGVVAQRYAATAIPQTVIIDQSGNVSKLFVGGGSKLPDQLREGISKLLSSPAANP